jgi:hypothetical protein
MPYNDRQEYVHSAAEAAAIAQANRQTEEPNTPVSLGPADAVVQLENELVQLRLKLDAFNAAAKRGDVQAIAGCDLRDLSIKVASAENALELARQAQAEAEREASRGTRDRREREFQLSVESAIAARVSIRRLYRDLAVAMGTLCASTERAIQLNHDLRAGAAFPDVEKTNQIRDIENRTSLIPLHDLLDAGYKTLMGFGYDLALTVPPLTAPEKKEL